MSLFNHLFPGTLYCTEAGSHNAELRFQNTVRVSGFIVPARPAQPPIVLHGWDPHVTCWEGRETSRELRALCYQY